MDKGERQPGIGESVKPANVANTRKPGFLSDLKNLLLLRRLDKTPTTPSAPAVTEQQPDLQSSAKTVVQHEPTGSTVITATRDREGVLSHNMMNVAPGIDASSLGDAVVIESAVDLSKPTVDASKKASDTGERVVGIHGGAVVTVEGGKVKMSSPQVLKVDPL